jgi:hypothetical protein
MPRLHSSICNHAVRISLEGCGSTIELYPHFKNLALVLTPAFTGRLHKALVFKTSAIVRSAIPPTNQINGLVDLGDDHIPVVCVQRNRATGNNPAQEAHND